MTVSFSFLEVFITSSRDEPKSFLSETMVSALLTASSLNQLPAISFSNNKFTNPFKPCPEKFLPFVSCRRKLEQPNSIKNAQELSYLPAIVPVMFQMSVIPLAVSISFIFWSNPAHAGLLSGFPGIESVPGPQLPSVDFLTRFNEENQKKYAENDARFKESPILKKLLEQTKLNKEKNHQQILDKYCVRGAEWGVGDCSADAMSPDERDSFISMLKQKAGIE